MTVWRTTASAMAYSCGLMVAVLGCKSEQRTSSQGMEEQPMTYEVQRLAAPMAIDADWDKPQWKAVEPIQLTYFMGDEPAHRPATQAKVLYDDEAIYVIFHVEDQYVRAVARQHQDMVCKDSCVEFFFTPGTDVSKGYFNLEMNCGGTMLFHFQVIPRKSAGRFDADALARIETAHTLPKNVDPEITTPTTWTLEYRIPFDLLTEYFPAAQKPAPGVTWRANFYKCGDDTSKPHWLTWSHVARPKPDFHVPECFGTLVFK